MTWLWIPITIAAALLQNIRTALQKHLKGRLSTNAATYTRYVFGFPLAILYLVALNAGFGLAPPAFNGAGWTARFVATVPPFGWWSVLLIAHFHGREPEQFGRVSRIGVSRACPTLPAGERFAGSRRGSPSCSMCADARCGASARRTFAARGFP